MRKKKGWPRKATAAGLIPLLLLTVLPGCVARHMPDWSGVQAVKPDTKTEVQLYRDSTLKGTRKIKGRFLSATDDSVTLKLKGGQTETFQKETIRKVRTRRPLGKRWQGWVALGVSALLVSQLGNLDGPESNRVYIQLLTTLPIATASFWGSKMGGIYEVPPNQRESPWFTGSSPAEVEKSENSRGEGRSPPPD